MSCHGISVQVHRQAWHVLMCIDWRKMIIENFSHLFTVSYCSSRLFNQRSNFHTQFALAANVGIKWLRILLSVIAQFGLKFLFARFISFFADTDALIYAGWLLSLYLENNLCFLLTAHTAYVVIHSTFFCLPAFNFLTRTCLCMAASMWFLNTFHNWLTLFPESNSQFSSQILFIESTSALS